MGFVTMRMCWWCVEKTLWFGVVCGYLVDFLEITVVSSSIMF